MECNLYDSQNLHCLETKYSANTRCTRMLETNVLQGFGVRLKNNVVTEGLMGDSYAMSHIECNGSELWILNYENPGSNPVLRC